MFAPRFDPNAVYEETPRAPKIVLSRKRKLAAAEIKDSSDESSSESEAEPVANKKIETEEKNSSSDSGSSSSSSSDSDSSSESESSSESDSDDGSESDSEPDSPKESEREKDSKSGANEKSTLAADASKLEGDKPVDKNDKNETLAESEPEAAENVDDMHVDSDELETPSHLAKHANILKKFSKSVKNQAESSSESDTEMEDAQDLAPFPQPELPQDADLVSHQYHQKNLDWLAEPQFSMPEVTRPFAEFALSPKIMANLTTHGYKDAFSVQVAVLDAVMGDLRKNKLAPDFQGDVLVNASTGSGKTLAYSIPIVEALHTRIISRVRAIVLVPTKPLISQVATTLRDLSNGTSLSVVSLTNDKSMKEEGSRLLRHPPDIVVSTPGRLVEHLLNGSISMEALRFLVIDEADKLLNQSFQNWCEVVVSAIEKWDRPAEHTGAVWKLQPQKMIFSATLTTDAGKLSLLKFNKPRLIVVNSKKQLVNEMFSVPNLLQEHSLRFTPSQTALKPLLLAKFMLHTNKLRSVLVFAKSNDATLRLTRILNDLFAQLAPEKKTNVAYINSTNNISNVRQRVLRDFDDGAISVLVATDLIARGIDVLSIKDVVNYDLPQSSRDYVHRVGRTARANQKGEAFTMCFGSGEGKWFDSIMADVSRANEIIELGEEPVSEHELAVYNNVMKSFQESMKNEH
ncbi:hypothetical protein OY671_005560 [Metschnikowia pulcherrima]|nr:hypothetical protein OY671_005560 [Metschnikowia pulcherrima]